MKPRIYKRGNHWYCRRFATSDCTGWGETASDAYQQWARRNSSQEAGRFALERKLAVAMLADAARHA